VLKDSKAWQAFKGSKDWLVRQALREYKVFKDFREQRE
jgi:hypothetical protein